MSQKRKFDDILDEPLLPTPGALSTQRTPVFDETLLSPPGKPSTHGALGLDESLLSPPPGTPSKQIYIPRL